MSLPGFHEQTKPLTPYEVETLLPMFVNGLAKAWGEEKALTADFMITRIREKKGIKIGGPRVRKLINHIRREDLLPGVLVATSKGYYLSLDPVVIANHISSLEGRAHEIQRIADLAKKHLRKILSDENRDF